MGISVSLLAMGTVPLVRGFATMTNYQGVLVEVGKFQGFFHGSYCNAIRHGLSDLFHQLLEALAPIGILTYSASMDRRSNGIGSLKAGYVTLNGALASNAGFLTSRLYKISRPPSSCSTTAEQLSTQSPQFT